MASNTVFSVTVHPYSSPTRGACAYELGSAPPNNKNAIIFIGGLGDGPHTVPYIRAVAKHLETTGKDLGYSVFEMRLRSSFIGFGTSSLKKDVEDIAALVKYLRGLGKEKIVLFGHSTGCQDCIEYADYIKHSSPPVDGFIMQGPISDREAMDDVFTTHQDSLLLADQWIAEDRAHDCLPKDKVPQDLGAPMTAYRFKSLVAKGGDDDYFSSDLDDEIVSKYWGRFNKPVLALHSADDEYVPEHVDQANQNKRFQKANPMVSSLSGLIPDASHAVLEEDAREWLARRVTEFLRTLEN
ncbi:hypothetical protein QQS21_012316 [Conoideocrella luteorostrata]|uniref:Uncharacterized protein n=1 Tax=Conoideocrella luteorostrata TaxID=1105319 RepID=A0AAJ0CBF4_9HYPO|nr:hypothetical protein QQS21_012316 [Conoideocrella luteorostrata]